MDVKFITTNRLLIDTVPITDGQVVVSKDYNDMFYDMSQMRYRIGSPVWEPAEDDNVTTGFTMTDGTVSIFQFVPNGGSDVVLQEGSPANFVIGKVGDVVDFSLMPECTREGYEFLGWYEDQAKNGEKIEVFPSKYPEGKTIFYASWREK